MPTLEEGSNPGGGNVTWEYKTLLEDNSAYSETIPTKVDTYTVRATVAETDNYQSGTGVTMFIIGLGQFSPTVTLENWVYGEKPNAPVVEGNLPQAKEKIVYFTANDMNNPLGGPPTEAGQYYVFVSIFPDKESGYAYADTYAEFSILPRPVTVTADSYTKKAGDKDPVWTAKVSNLASGDKASLIQYTLTRKTGEEPGTYAITPNGEELQGNYKVSYVTGTLTISTPDATDKPTEAPTATPTAVPTATPTPLPTRKPTPALYTVSFLANGGRGTMDPVTVTEGTAYVLPACGFTAPEDQLFDTWDLGKPGETIVIRGNTTVKAQWKDIPIRPGKTLLVKLLPNGNTTLKLTWEKAAGAEGYDLYWAKCSTEDFTLAGTVNASEARSFILRGLTKGTSYKAYVQAWHTVNGKKRNLGNRSPMVHAIAGASSRLETTPKSITVKKKEIMVQRGKTAVIEATVNGYDKSKALIDHSDGLLRYYSSNIWVAAVNRDGKVLGRNAGSCVIYVLASNGIRAEVEILVSKEAPPETEVTCQGGIYRLNKAGTEAVFAGPQKKSAEKLTIAATVNIGGKNYTVTRIDANACSGMKNLKSLTIGKNVEKIGKKAFYNCPALTSITLKTEKLTENGIGADAFSRGAKKPKVRCPEQMLKKYSKWLKDRGISKDAAFLSL